MRSRAGEAWRTACRGSTLRSTVTSAHAPQSDDRPAPRRSTTAALPPHPRIAAVPQRSRLGNNADLLCAIATALLLLVAWLLHADHAPPGPLAGAAYGLAYAFGAAMPLWTLITAIRNRTPWLDVDLLMLAAAAGAAVIEKYAEGAFLLFLFSLAHALERYALGRARNAIRALADLSPPQARVLRDGIESALLIEDVRPGDLVIVRPAERIPVDGTVHHGRSAVDQAPLTGESLPVEKAVSDPVFAGTLNGDGALEITTTRAAGDRTLDRVIQLVEQAQTQRAPTQRFAERFTRVFVPLVLLADALLILVPALAGWLTWEQSFYRGMTVLVGASPCALALGTPAVVLAGIAQAARRGVLIKGGAHLENLGIVRAIAFDKTGTLTVGRPEITDVQPCSGVSQTELLRIAAAVEQRSQHPLAAAVLRHAHQVRIEPPAVQDAQSITARGVRGMVEGRVAEVGSLRLWSGVGDEPPAEVRSAVESLERIGRTTLAVRHDGRWLGVIGAMDRPRPAAADTLASLRAQGVTHLLMLTGDNRAVAESVAREVGVDAFAADLLPEDKVQKIRELLQSHGPVAMVGDGVNDAPALAQATVGIAMGGAGTAVALETADVALMGDDLSRLPFAVGLSRRARVIIRQNVVFALGVIGVLIVAGATGLATIGPAVVLHEGSTIVVILNALRLLGFNGPGRRTEGN
ncbi:MAG: heavy metal translocating P-type ATPase [Phycisphaerales bacterium]|nr:heavy metal translocating P-type ATPase [Phycisphaerales bacterium]